MTWSWSYPSFKQLPSQRHVKWNQGKQLLSCGHAQNGRDTTQSSVYGTPKVPSMIPTHPIPVTDTSRGSQKTKPGVTLVLRPRKGTAGASLGGRYTGTASIHVRMYESQHMCAHIYTSVHVYTQLCVWTSICIHIDRANPDKNTRMKKKRYFLV